MARKGAFLEKEKQCTCCKEMTVDFYIGQSWCRPCTAKNTKRWREENNILEKMKGKYAITKAENPEKHTKKLEWTREYRKRMMVEGPQCSLCHRKGLLRRKLCEHCYKKQLRKKNMENPAYRQELREKALLYSRKKAGLPINLIKMIRSSGEGTYQFGYKILTKNGHPNSNKRGRILEHVFVMSEHLKRPLHKHENVHHLNGIRDDNRIENLELWSRSQPPGQRVEDKIKWAKQFLKEYGYNVNN